MQNRVKCLDLSVALAQQRLRLLDADSGALQQRLDLLHVLLQLQQLPRLEVVVVAEVAGDPAAQLCFEALELILERVNVARALLDTCRLLRLLGSWRAFLALLHLGRLLPAATACLQILLFSIIFQRPFT